nr:unnamed protein product [Digitaria exilis]
MSRKRRLAGGGHSSGEREASTRRPYHPGDGSEQCGQLADRRQAGYARASAVVNEGVGVPCHGLCREAGKD